MNRHRASSRPSSPQQGQTFIIILFFISALLLAALGIATDYTQVWAHRQMAQGAADAACQAGAADLNLYGTDPTATNDFPGLDFSWIGSPFDCSAKPNSPPCQYATFNGYTGSKVAVSFPGGVSGVSPIPGGFPTVTYPYLKVTVTDPVPMSFTKLYSSTTVVNVTASANCGLFPVNTPVPLVVLHTTAGPAMQVTGTAGVTIYGGPQRSIQVDSSSSTAVAVGTVDLHQAGPTNSGGDFAVLGGPTTQPVGVNVGSTGHWIPGASPFGDPFASVPVPAQPSTGGTARPVPFGINGCPDPIGCVEFTPGDYTGCSTSPIAPGAKGCLDLPYSGSNPSFNAGGTNWQANHTYAVGTLIKPATPTCASTSNPGGYVYIAKVGGTSSPTSCPALFNQTVCTRQADGTCSGGTTIDGTVTWQNVGVVSTSPKTAIFDPGLYYVAAHGLSFGPDSTARMSTATGDGSHGVMFYFSTSASLSIGSSSGSAGVCTAVPYPYTSCTACTPQPGQSSCNLGKSVVPYQINGSLSPAATGYVASIPLNCPGGSGNPSVVPASLAGNILLGPCGGTSGIGAIGQYGSPDGNRGFLFFQNRSTAANGGSCTGGFGGTCAILGGGGSFIFSGFIYFHEGNGSTCGSGTSCLSLAGGSGGNSFTIGDIVVDKISLVGNSGVKMILNPAASFAVLRPTLLQ